MNTTRMTQAEAQAAATRYAQTLANAGVICDDHADQVTIAKPYGQVWYLVRYDRDAHAYYHDIPGFTGSGGSGAISLRELVERVRHSTGLIFDLKSVTAPWVA